MGSVCGGGCNSEGDNFGEENESKYKPMKKSSLRAQKMNNTVCSCQLEHQNGFMEK